MNLISITSHIQEGTTNITNITKITTNTTKCIHQADMGEAMEAAMGADMEVDTEAVMGAAWNTFPED